MLPAAVWVLGVVPPPRDGLTASFLVPYTLLLLGLTVVDQTAPDARRPWWQRGLWLLAELVLCALVVRVHGTLIRPALIYLVPTSRALLLFEGRTGLALSLGAWVAYSLNNLTMLWPDRLVETPNYLSFFLGPYVLAVAFTWAAQNQARQRQRLEDLYQELSEAHQQLKSLAKQQQELAVTQERNRVAREIHDSLAHYLTVVSVQLEAAEKLATTDQPKALDSVQRARRLTVACLQEVRRSVASLRAASLEELSLAAALDNLSREFHEATGIEVQVDVSLPDQLQLPPEKSLALYRAAQEGLTNVGRHAKATAVTLQVMQHAGRVELVLEDNGVGPPKTAALSDGGGFGLLGVKERVALLDGAMEFGPGAAGGSRLAVTIPHE